MKLWAEFELLGLSFPPKLGYSDVISVHVWVGYFSDKLVILFEELLYLVINRKEILKVEPFGSSLLSGGLSIFVVRVDFLDGLRHWHFLKVIDGQVEVLNKETRKVVFFKWVDLAIVIIEHLVGYFFNGWTTLFNLALDVACMVVLCLLHFTLTVVTAT